MDPVTINAMLGATPGAVVVEHGGYAGWGHSAHVPIGFGDGAGAIQSRPSVVIASGFFPGVCIDESRGEVTGIGEVLIVDAHDWYVRDIEPAEAPGEIRVFLSNRGS